MVKFDIRKIWQKFPIVFSSWLHAFFFIKRKSWTYMYVQFTYIYAWSWFGIWITDTPSSSKGKQGLSFWIAIKGNHKRIFTTWGNITNTNLCVCVLYDEFPINIPLFFIFPLSRPPFPIIFPPSALHPSFTHTSVMETIFSLGKQYRQIGL